ncbi:MAG: hypothetical protein HS132_01800 [Planctomycetia bacterium]|nr:hypothetical protein [Planctomycetia bacterium]
MSSNEKDLRPEYPPELIRSGTRGKYAQRYRDEGTNVALIDQYLHKLFPDSDAVDRALRDYVDKREGSAT